MSLAELSGPNGLTIHTASQSPSFVRTEISRLLGWPENRVRVRTAFLGGGFGAKLYIKLEAMVAVCALLVRKPVRIALTMDEQFYTITKHGATVRIKTGVSNDGRMVAREVETFWNGGAYADIGPRVTQKSGFTAAGPYDIEHVALNNYAVYTNEPPAGALARLRHLAARLGLRASGRHHRQGRSGSIRWSSAAATRCATAARMPPARPSRAWRSMPCSTRWRRRWSGTAHSIAAQGRSAADAASRSASRHAFRRRHRRRSCRSTATAAARCTAAQWTWARGRTRRSRRSRQRCSGIPTTSVRVVHPDTDVTPYDMATLGSRSTYHMGNAVRRAAEDARDQLLRIAGTAFGTDIVELECRDQAIVSRSGARMTFREVMLARFAMQAGTVVGFGSFAPPYKKADPETGQSPDITPFWMLGRRRRGNRGRLRDRADRGDEAGQRWRRRSCDQPGVRGAAA